MPVAESRLGAVADTVRVSAGGVARLMTGALTTLSTGVTRLTARRPLAPTTPLATDYTPPQPHNTPVNTLSKEHIPRAHIPRNILARMPLTSHEEIGRVGCVGRGCYEDVRENVGVSRENCFHGI